MRQTTKRLRIFTWMIILYLVMALIWWSVLLYAKNKEAWEAQAKILAISYGKDFNDADLLKDPAYVLLKNKYKKQEYMIFGEGLIFILSLGVGIGLMNRGFVKELKVADQQKNFLLSITHELKSPLAGIKLSIETIKSRKLSEKQLETLSSVALNDLNRLNDLVSNLILAARMEGAYVPVLKMENVLTLVKECCDIQQERFPEANIEILCEPDLEANFDRNGMAFVLQNLIENGLKYNQAQKAVIQVKAYIPEKGKFRIEVADNGIGIPNHEREMIFEKFYRIGSEDTRQTKGTGLGLYIVKGIIKAHSGAVWVANENTNGTIFILEIPN